MTRARAAVEKSTKNAAEKAFKLPQRFCNNLNVLLQAVISTKPVQSF